MVDITKISQLKWINIPTPDDVGIRYLEENFDFHPLDIEDCQSKVQRPKIDIYDDYYFLILHFPYFDKALKFVKLIEVKIFWGQDYIITVGKLHWVIRSLLKEIKENKDLGQEDLPNNSDTLLYKILKSLHLETYKILRIIDGSLENISSEMFEKKAESVIEKISSTRKNLILLNTALKPQLRLFSQFESGRVDGFAQDMEDYWGDILDLLQKNWDTIEDYEELIKGFAQTFDSAQANRTNEIMKVLTLFSATLLPLTFLTGLYGMNVDLPLAKNKEAFLFIGSILIIIVIILLFYFRRRKWI